jgi:imidazolonepropionase-like amidohydrolase/Tol biopolymer transport system component
VTNRSIGLGVVGALLFAQSGAAPPASSRSAERVSTRTVAFDTDEVTEAAVAVSPDGSTLVFTMLGHLFRVPLSGDGGERGTGTVATAQQLTYGPYYDGDPAFSPDGSKIAFVSDRGARHGSEFGVFVFDVATKKIRQLTREPFAIRPTFTAQGDAIDYLGAPPQPAFPGSLIVRRIAVSGGEGKTLRGVPEQYRSIFRLADGRMAWSIAEMKPGSGSSRTRIETSGDDGKVVLIATCDGVLERVEASPAGDGVFARRTTGGPSLGSDQSEELVFVATGAAAAGAVRSIAAVDAKSGPRPRIAVRSATLFAGDAGHLFRFDTVSGARELIPMRAQVRLEIESPVRPQPIRRASGVIANPLTVPGGGLIFEAAGHLWTQPIDGSAAHRIEDRTAGPRAMESSPALSPDGKMLAFVHSQGTGMELRVMELATGEARTIASGAGYSQPSWSADGSRLVFVESAGFSATIVAVSSDGKSRTEIGQAGFWSSRPNLSADGRWLYVTANVAGVGNVFRQGADGSPSTSEPLTKLTRHASDGLLSPDGKWLAFRRNKEIWVARIADPGGAAGPVTDVDVRRFAEEGGDGFSFASDSSSLIYAVGGHVYKQPVAGGARAEIPIHLERPHPLPIPLLVRHARLLDFDSGTFRPPTSVFIEDGRIMWIGSEDGRAIPGDASILDAAGKFAIPGLFEMHAHAAGANQGAFIAYGVTSVRDTGGTIVGSNEIADRAEGSDDPIPRYFFAGEIFEGEHPYWGDGFLQIQNEEDAGAYVRRFKGAGASFIKVYPSLPWPLQLAVIDEARRVGLPVVGHGMSVNEITRSVTHGFASIEHTVFPTRIYGDVIRMLAASQTRWDPTLAVVGGDSQLLRKDPARLSDAKLVAVTPPWAIETAKSAGYEKDMSDDALNKAWEGQLASIREAHAWGVKLAIGTDAPNPACFYGASLHWELEFFAAAGIPPIDVLRMATADAARTVGASDLGVIAPGKLADLVLLDANPLENIRNTQAIWRVVKGGWVFDPAQLGL